MSDNITLEQLQTAQNNFINQRTAEINQLKSDNAAALTALEALSQRTYGYAHDSFAVKDIETVYNDIITENPELTDKSAIGFAALLSEGETISKQGNVMYINGEEEAEDYTFSGTNTENGNELVTVWYFSNNGALNFTADSLDTVKVSIVKSDDDNSTINISDANINHSREVIYNNFFPSVAYNAGKVTAGNYTGNTINKSIKMSNTTRKFSTDLKAVSFTSSGPNFYETLTALETLDFPELETVESTSAVMLNMFRFINHNAVLNMPKLKTLKWKSHQDCSFCSYVLAFTLPETLEVVTRSGGAVLDNIRQKIILNCINLESMPSGWYRGTPPLELEIADNWACSIDLSVCAPSAAGSEWLDKSIWVDMFADTLRDMGDDVREMKIPPAIYDELAEEEFEIAEDKGWTIGC